MGDSIKRLGGVRLEALLFSILLSSGSAKGAPACPEPTAMTFVAERQVQRSAIGFTQGLERSGSGWLESTGPLAGPTRLNRIAADGRVRTLADLGSTVFGEGMTVLDGRVYQLTWKDHRVFVYTAQGRRVREMLNPRDGWGLTNDGSDLVFTDGGDRLIWAAPATFKELRSVQVRAGERPVRGLNELEWVNDRIYANLFATDQVVRVAPETGCVEAVADLSGLRKLMTESERARLAANPEFVLNGLSHNPDDGRMTVTGKGWRTLFVGRFLEAPRR